MVVIDLIISSGIGSVAVMLILDPGSGKDAAIAGLGLTGILSALGRDA